MTRELPERFRRLITLVAPSLPRIATGSSHFHSLRPEGFRWHAAYAEPWKWKKPILLLCFMGFPFWTSFQLVGCSMLLEASQHQTVSTSRA